MLIIYGNSFHLRSAQDNVRKYVCVASCLAIVLTSYKHSLQYAIVSLVELINENAVLIEAKVSVVPLKSFLTVPAVTVAGLVL